MDLVAVNATVQLTSHRNAATVTASALIYLAWAALIVSQMRLRVEARRPQAPGGPGTRGVRAGSTGAGSGPQGGA